MLEDLRKLVDLQKLDDEVAAATAEQAEVPRRRGELLATREAAESRLREAAELLEAAAAAQRRAEGELADREAQLQKLEGQQFQVKSNEAYTALLSEMEAAREAISGCETRILEAMEAIEQAAEQRRSAETHSRAVDSRTRDEGASLDAREKEVGARLATLRERRSELVAEVERGLLAQYERIATRHRPAVARVRDEMCQGCRVHVPSRLAMELLKGERVVVCTNCHRILIPQQLADAGE